MSQSRARKEALRRKARRLSKLSSYERMVSTPSVEFAEEPSPENPRISNRLMLVAAGELRAAPSLDAAQASICCAMDAWNISLLPEEQRSEWIDRCTSRYVPLEPRPDFVPLFREMLAELVERKLHFFPDDARAVSYAYIDRWSPNGVSVRAAAMVFREDTGELLRVEDERIMDILAGSPGGEYPEPLRLDEEESGTS